MYFPFGTVLSTTLSTLAANEQRLGVSGGISPQSFITQIPPPLRQTARCRLASLSIEKLFPNSDYYLS
jgi:hypothetical protein